MKRMLLALVVMALLMLPLAMPAVAQGDGGCKAFGQSTSKSASGQGSRFGEAVSGHATHNDTVKAEKTDLCR
jgi:hypothetical protein